MSHEQPAQSNPIDWQRWSNGLSAENEAQAILAEMIERLSNAICAVVRRHVQDEHEAEELTNNVFLRIWQNRTRFNPKRGLLWNWIQVYAIRSEVTLYHKRKARRPVSVCQPHDVLEGLLSHRPEEETPHCPEEDTHAAHQAERLHDAVASLGERQKQVIDASFDGDCRTDIEIAEHLEMTPGGVRKARHDALKNLRQRTEETN